MSMSKSPETISLSASWWERKSMYRGSFLSPSASRAFLSSPRELPMNEISVSRFIPSEGCLIIQEIVLQWIDLCIWWKRSCFCGLYLQNHGDQSRSDNDLIAFRECVCDVFTDNRGNVCVGNLSFQALCIALLSAPGGWARGSNLCPRIAIACKGFHAFSQYHCRQMYYGGRADY